MTRWTKIRGTCHQHRNQNLGGEVGLRLRKIQSLHWRDQQRTHPNPNDGEDRLNHVLMNRPVNLAPSQFLRQRQVESRVGGGKP
jgi:hypothetical protein